MSRDARAGSCMWDNTCRPCTWLPDRGCAAYVRAYAVAPRLRSGVGRACACMRGKTVTITHGLVKDTTRDRAFHDASALRQTAWVHPRPERLRYRLRTRQRKSLEGGNERSSPKGYLVPSCQSTPRMVATEHWIDCSARRQDTRQSG